MDIPTILFFISGAKSKNQRTDSPESRLVYTRLEVALQILERKIYKNTKIASLYS